MTYQTQEKPKTRARKRQGRCYELAHKTLMKMDNPGSWRLIHGVVEYNKGHVIDHAWLSDGNEVFDAVLNRFFPINEYCDGRVEVHASYSQKEAAVACLEHDSYGRWHT